MKWQTTPSACQLFYKPFLSTKHKPQPEHLNLSKPSQIFTCPWNVCNLSKNLSHFVHFNEVLHIW